MRDRDHIVESAKRLARRGDYQGAIRAYERLVEARPDDLEARLKIGYLHACNRDREAAAEVYLEVAHAYEYAGDPATAAKVLTQVLRLRPEQVDVYFWLANLLGGTGQPAEARRWLEAVERLLLEQQGAKEALRAVEAMVELDPGNVALLIRLGEGLVHAGRRSEATASLRQAADVLRAAEWMDDFIKVAERILYLEPTDLPLAKELAVLYLRRKDARAALRKLQRCYRAHNDDPETLGLLVEAFLSLGEKGKAVTILEALAELHLARGEAQAQEAAWKRILTLNPGWVPKGSAASPDTQVGEPPTELLREDHSWDDLPLTTDEHQLATLERSLQPDPASGGQGRRFLPALTAASAAPAASVASEKPSRRAGGGTTELDLGDLEEVALLEELERSVSDGIPTVPGLGAKGSRSQTPAPRQASRASPRRVPRPGPPSSSAPSGPVLTQELDLGDLEFQEAGTGRGLSDDVAELEALEAMIDEETEKRPPFRPATTVPDGLADSRRRDTQISKPRRPRRR